MSGFFRGFLAALAFVGLVLTGLYLAMPKARAQVQGLPVLAMPGADAFYDLDIRTLKGCAGYWVRDTDRFGDYRLQVAALDLSGADDSLKQTFSAALPTGDLVTLTKLRNREIRDMAVALPCRNGATRDDGTVIAAVQPPAKWAAWIVAPATAGKRPAYVLNADGTRGKQSGYAETTISGNGKTMPMWCNAKVRSVEATSSVYATWATARQTFTDPDAGDAAEPVRVTLCKEVK